MPSPLAIDRKICRKCDSEKPLTDFFRSTGSRDGRHTLCKSCQKANTKKWQRANPEKRRKYRKTDYARHRDTVQARNKRWYERNRESVIFRTNRNAKQNAPAVRDARLRRAYGISLAEVEAMMEAQGGVCAICRNPERLGKKKLCVDHCHATGRVRGLLCQQCNRALGLLGDVPAYLRSALAYLGAE